MTKCEVKTMTKFQELLTNLETLGLDKMYAYLPDYIDQINQQQLSFTDAMLNLTEAEVHWRGEQEVQRIIRRARFPQEKTLKAFDFDLTSISKRCLVSKTWLSWTSKKI